MILVSFMFIFFVGLSSSQGNSKINHLKFKNNVRNILISIRWKWFLLQQWHVLRREQACKESRERNPWYDVIELSYFTVILLFTLLVIALKSQISNPSCGKPAIIFDAYRTSSFSNLKSIINYNGLYVNEGGAMNASSGIFKAPFNGIYEFHFHGTTNWLSVANDHIRVRLTVNNAWKTMAHGDKTHTHLLFISAIFEL